MDSKLTDNIRKQISNITDALAWVEANAPDDRRSKFMELVGQRRQLHSLLRAETENPAIAAFGVSQVGKSYLMACMLQKDGHHFMLEGEKRKYDFIDEMNPQTKNTEATGVVTRFSSFARNPELYSPEHPIMMKCLNVSAIATILGDGYYNDLTGHDLWDSAELKKRSKQMLDKYAQMPVQSEPRITADEVMEMKEYFMKHLSSAVALYGHSPFFDDLAYVAERIPESDLSSVLSLIWHELKPMTEVFDTLLGTLSRLGFAEVVYLPDEALLHNFNNRNTVMSVECLNGLFDETAEFKTDVYVRTDKGFKTVANIPKSQVGAICAEIVVRIGDEYLDNKATYTLSSIESDRVRQKLKGSRESYKDSNDLEVVDVPMDILRTNDLLDFPGARGREKFHVSALSDRRTLMMVYLRGKVAYLFNHYNESRLINVLLYCHHADQHDVSEIPLMINDWIQTYVGNSPEARRKAIQETGGVSPFFYVATKFNMDIAPSDESPLKNLRSAIAGRWNQRFDKVLKAKSLQYAISVDSSGSKIFSQWTGNSMADRFDNSYLLRDFAYSTNIYSGEKTRNGKNLLESPIEGKEKWVAYLSLLGGEERAQMEKELNNYATNLRETFTASEDVQQLFGDPELAWDAAASMHNDGAALILDRLTTVATHMDKARSESFAELVSKIAGRVAGAMKDYVVSTDVDEILDTNIRNARKIFRELSFTCNADNYYFGHLLRALQLTEGKAYRVINAVINDPERLGKSHDFSQYEILVKDMANNGFEFDSLNTEAKQWEALMTTYGFDSREEGKEFLNQHEVDFDKLFSGSFKRKKTSYVLADAVYDYWHDRVKSAEVLNESTGNSTFDISAMNLLTGLLVKSAQTVRLADRMAEDIEEFVNSTDVANINQRLVADMLASRINRFVLDFGYSMLDDKKQTNARDMSLKHKLPAYRYIGKERPELKDLDDLNELFDQMTERPEALLPSFDHRYNSWVEHLFISCVYNLEMPEGYDKAANDRLKALLQSIAG